MRTCKWIDKAIEISRRDPPPSYTEIAREVGVTRQAVNRQFLARGIPHVNYNGGRYKKFRDEERFCHQCGKPFTWTAEQQSHWHARQRKGLNPRKLVLCSKSCVGASSYKGCCFVCKQPLDKTRDYRHAHRECQSQWMRDYYVRRRTQQRGLAGNGETGIIAADRP